MGFSAAISSTPPPTTLYSVEIDIKDLTYDDRENIIKIMSENGQIPNLQNKEAFRLASGTVFIVHFSELYQLAGMNRIQEFIDAYKTNKQFNQKIEKIIED